MFKTPTKSSEDALTLPCLQKRNYYLMTDNSTEPSKSINSNWSRIKGKASMTSNNFIFLKSTLKLIKIPLNQMITKKSLIKSIKFNRKNTMVANKWKKNPQLLINTKLSSLFYKIPFFTIKNQRNTKTLQKIPNPADPNQKIHQATIRLT